MDRAVGKNNGTVRGKKYFECPKKHGLLVKAWEVEAIDSAPKDASTRIQASHSNDVAESETTQAGSPHAATASERKIHDARNAFKGFAMTHYGALTKGEMNALFERLRMKRGTGVIERRNYFEKALADMKAVEKRRDGMISLETFTQWYKQNEAPDITSVVQPGGSALTTGGPATTKDSKSYPVPTRPVPLRPRNPPRGGPSEVRSPVDAPSGSAVDMEGLATHHKDNDDGQCQGCQQCIVS
jgi:Ca2+-binding EF-hand superfamily protein